ncbi:MAG: hypothetical protein GY761_05145, partial [Hyphomicrobiales bacterium]|nr:hypothetical protein [Hyphomicrobiales bacterium]
MEILFRRQQTPGKMGRVKFKLWSKIELDDIEKQVVRRYSFSNAILIDSWQPELIRKTAYVGAGVFALASFLFSSFAGFSFGTFLGLIAGGAAAYFYYDKNRETIFVKDLLHGRFFSCDSVIELARKEAWLETITGFLRQVMEGAKHWDGTETRNIEVLPKEEAKQLMIR